MPTRRVDFIVMCLCCVLYYCWCCCVCVVDVVVVVSHCGVVSHTLLVVVGGYVVADLAYCFPVLAFLASPLIGSMSL